MPNTLQTRLSKMDVAQPICPATSVPDLMDIDLGPSHNSFALSPFECGSFDLATIESPAETNGSLSPKANGIEHLHEAGNDLASIEPPAASTEVNLAARPKQKRNRKAPTKKDKDWQRVRGMLTELYPSEKLEVVMQKIKEKYGFEAT